MIESVLTMLSGIIFPLLALYIFLYYEKKNAIKVISYYNDLLKLRLKNQELNSIQLIELDPTGRVKYVLKLIPYAPILPFANIIKHLNVALEKSRKFIKECHESSDFSFEENVQNLLTQRDACLQFYFMAEMLTCNPIAFRVHSKKWMDDNFYVKNYFKNIIPDLVEVKFKS